MCVTNGGKKNEEQNQREAKDNENIRYLGFQSTGDFPPLSRAVCFPLEYVVGSSYEIKFPSICGSKRKGGPL